MNPVCSSGRVSFIQQEKGGVYLPAPNNGAGPAVIRLLTKNSPPGHPIALGFFCPAKPEITGIWNKENRFASGM